MQCHRLDLLLLDCETLEVQFWSPRNPYFSNIHDCQAFYCVCVHFFTWFCFVSLLIVFFFFLSIPALKCVLAKNCIALSSAYKLHRAVFYIILFAIFQQKFGSRRLWKGYSLQTHCTRIVPIICDCSYLCLNLNQQCLCLLHA